MGRLVQDRYEEDHITYEYRSDFDILIATADRAAERDVAYDCALKQALEPLEGGTRVNFIVNTIQLYDAGRYHLDRPPKELPPEAMLRHAEEYFEEWMDRAQGFFEMYLARCQVGETRSGGSAIPFRPFPDRGYGGGKGDEIGRADEKASAG